jgi:hypothetical protein
VVLIGALHRSAFCRSGDPQARLDGGRSSGGDDASAVVVAGEARPRGIGGVDSKVAVSAPFGSAAL